jgi:hypothetical protein
MIWAQVPFWLLKIKKTENVFFDILFGIAFLCLISMCFVIGGPINLVTQIIFLFCTMAIAFLQREAFISRINQLISTLRSLNKFEIILLILLIIPVLYQSAQATKINDNGGYYQPTIAWMEQYGLIKGLANIYPALGLFSAWHSLTALFDLNQAGFGSFHQINGFLLSWLIFWIFIEIKLTISTQLKSILVMMLGFILVFGFFFLSAPNADFPIICFSGLIIYTMLSKKEIFHPLIWWIICLAIFCIKPPGVTGIIIAFMILFEKAFSLKSKLNSLSILLPIIGILVFKNVMLSGYVFYPMNQPDIMKVEWKVPKNWNDLYRKGIVNWGINDKDDIKDWKVEEQTKFNRLSKWLSRSGYKGFINKILFSNWTIALILLGILTITKFKNHQKTLLIVTLLLLFQVFEWLYLSQYRLMLSTGLSILLLNIYILFNTLEKRISNWGKFPIIMNLSLGSFILIIWTFAFVPFSAFSETSRNKSITKSEGFKSTYLIEPWHQFDNGSIYTNRFNGMVFYYYPARGYCWDCPLPCVSRSHHDYLLKNLGLEVKPLGKTPLEGFKLIEKDDLR